MNYFAAIWCLLAVAASSTASGGLGYGGLLYAPGHASADYYAYPRYAFEYAVRDPHTGDNKAQWEKRDGDVVRGAYSLVEPDGNLRIVEYWADSKSGFNAVVKRVGPSLHPTTLPVAPIYKAPIPVLSSGPVVAPISVGPIAKYSGLAGAPLITGPLGYGGGAISTSSLYKAAPIVVPAPVAPVIAPIAPLPIIKPAPLPYALPAPLIKSVPYIGGSYYNSLPGQILPAAPAPILKGPVGIPAVSLGEGLLRGYPGGYDGLGLAKGGYGYGLGAPKGGPILPPLSGGYGGYH